MNNANVAAAAAAVERGQQLIYLPEIIISESISAGIRTDGGAQAGSSETIKRVNAFFVSAVRTQYIRILYKCLFVPVFVKLV